MLRICRSAGDTYVGIFSILLCAVTVNLSHAQQAQLSPSSRGIAPAFVIADSGVKLSGSGTHWSEWYRLGVRTAPKGYTVEKAEFWLTGDRSCGVSAECRELVQNDQQVLWEFRLQGHNEAGVAKTDNSEGHIRVTYRPQ
jgi:hypothetical protein